MKKVSFTALTLIVIMLITGGRVFGQPPVNNLPDQTRSTNRPFIHNGEFGIPNLTDDQKTKIKDLRLNNIRETKVFRNQLGELKARERTLTTADKPDLKAIDSNIDEITKARGQILKAKAHFVQQVRALLTDEQRTIFDSHHENHRFHGGNNFESERHFDKG